MVKQFVIDYTRETQDPLMEHEVNGLDYRYVYGNERLGVNISPIENGAGSVVESGTVGQQIRLYYHQDLRGTVDYLTSPVSQKVESWTHYNEWGEITHNAVLKCGQRELDLVKNYTCHDFDAVLNLYYAKARMYDAENRRFVALDPIMDGSVYDISERVTDPMMFVKYLYVKDNPLRWIDPLGLKYSLAQGSIAHAIIEAYITWLYPSAITDQYVYGLTRTKSGRGRPDVVIKSENVYHVYEIKSDTYLSWGKYKQSAFVQLNSYVGALANKPTLNSKNFPNSTTAIKGTILDWEEHIILPYLADSNKVIEAWTEKSDPGMIYYKIRDKKKKDEVKNESFVTDDLRVTVGYYAMVTCEYAPEDDMNLVNIDTYGDKELNNDIISLLKGAVEYREVGVNYHYICFPDGKVVYTNLYPLPILNNFIVDLTNYESLFHIYFGDNDNWSSSENFVPKGGGGSSTTPVLPIPNVPAITPVTIPITAPALVPVLA